MGEGGHFIDTLSWWVGSLPDEVYAVSGPGKDDVQVSLRFENGATGVITYATNGNVRFPKETFDAAAGGRTARLDNFRKAMVWTGRGHRTTRARGGQDKGQANQLAQFVKAARAGSAMPIALNDLVAVTKATIAVRASLSSRRPERI